MSEDTGRKEIPITDGPAPARDAGEGTHHEPTVVPGSAAAKAYQQQAGQAHSEPAHQQPAETPHGGETAAEPVRELEAKLKEAEQKAAELNDHLVRSMAEFDNYRKRSERERVALVNRATAGLLKDLLPVVDHLQLALNSDNVTLESLRSGVEMIQRQLLEVLSRHGLEEIVAIGRHFDPAFHEALMSQPSAEHEEGQVVQVLQTGYAVSGVVLRPARVAVAAPRADADEGSSDNS